MRIVLSPQGTHGDARPLVALGIALRSAGHHVVFGASPDHREWIEKLGFRCHPVGLAMEAPSEDVDRAVGNPLRVALKGIKFITELVPAQFAALSELMDDAELVIGSGLDFAGRTLAERKNIPYRFVYHVPTALRSSYHPPAAIPYRPLPSWINRWLWWSNTLGTKWTFGRGIQKMRKQLGMPPVRDFARFFSTDVIMAADEPLAPLPPDCSVDMRTGYFALDDTRALPDDLEEFLARGEPPIYIGFGSMADAKPQRTLQILEAVARRWRLVVFNRRARRLCPTGLANVHWVDSVPHHTLFRRVAAVVHHGGAGTTHTAARAGVPQIIVPHLLDQYYWGCRVQQLGIGPRPLNLRKLSARGLSDALDQMSNGSALQVSAAAFASQLVQPARTSLRDTVRYLEANRAAAGSNATP